MGTEAREKWVGKVQTARVQEAGKLGRKAAGIRAGEGLAPSGEMGTDVSKELLQSHLTCK